MEDFILDFFTVLENINFNLVLQGLGVGVFAFWVIVMGWVWYDSSERYKKLWPRILSVAIVFAFNILGLIIYLIIRPNETFEEAYWMDLERRYLKFESAGLVDCLSCGEELYPNFIYCPNCGASVRKKCASCDVYLELDWKICPFCGEKQEEVEQHVVAKVVKKDKDSDSTKSTVEAGKPKGSDQKVESDGSGFMRFLGKLPGLRSSTKPKKKGSGKNKKSKKDKSEKKRKKSKKSKKKKSKRKKTKKDKKSKKSKKDTKEK